MIDSVKDSITWLFNQEDARKIIEVINPREFTVVEAILVQDNEAKVAAETSRMVQWERNEAVNNMNRWMNDVNKMFKHNPGERYIYFRFKRFH